MEIACAECGCRVDRGVRVKICDDPNCCCAHLPARASAEPEVGGRSRPGVVHRPQ